MKEQIIREFNGRIIGFIQEDEKGNKIVRDFHRRVLGRYDKVSNTTRDFYGRVIAKGDSSAMLFNYKK